MIAPQCTTFRKTNESFYLLLWRVYAEPLPLSSAHPCTPPSERGIMTTCYLSNVSPFGGGVWWSRVRGGGGFLWSVPGSRFLSCFPPPPNAHPDAPPLNEGDNAHVLPARSVLLWRGSVVAVCAGRGRFPVKCSGE